MGDARRGCCHRGGDSLFMRIFRQTFVIDSILPAQETWKKLLPVVKTPPPICAECGQTLGGAIFVRTAGSPRRPRYRKPGCNATLPRAASSSRAISHRRSSISPHHFVPELLYSGTPGTIRAVGHGTRIVIEMTMHPMGYLFPSWECREYVRSAFDPCVRSLGFAGGCRRRVCRALLIVAVCWIAFAGEASTARGAGSSAPLVARRKTPERGGYAFCSDDHAESPINIRHLALSENPSG